MIGTNSVAIETSVVTKTFSEANSLSPPSSFATTNVETAVGVPSITTQAVNVADGFVRLGHVGPWPVRVLSEPIRLLVLLAAVIVVVGRLYSHE
ncbi:hypothetical protein KWG76_04020 [Haloterrigena longa]|uniref:Uncharacterized protein n=1 Tax=Natrinema longum TaxID=370324 RepID=A0A8A2U7A0_9EURY|nr:hypothetical protein [Natrinema longum]QSW84580.1 hypothetical protein J0X27_14145 [Natrinema longum]